MREDRIETLRVLGEDNVGGMGADGEIDAWGGVLGVTKGLHAKVGDRIMDTPITESAFIGSSGSSGSLGFSNVAFQLRLIDFSLGNHP